MSDFPEIEERYADYLLSIDIDTLKADGRLNLASTDAQVILQSSAELGFPRDDKGWFRLTLQGSDGDTVSLRKAIVVYQSITYKNQGASRSKQKTHIFGNTVILKSQNVDGGDSVTKIRFSMKNLTSFFYYWPVESFRSFGGNNFGDLLELARERDGGPGYDQHADTNNPTGVVFINDIPEPIRFAIENATYSVFISRTESFPSPDGYKITSNPLIYIEFKNKVTIEHALGKMWAVHGFFSQLANEKLVISKVLASDGLDERSEWAHIYLPFIARRQETGKPRYSPYNIPYCTWEERGQLSSLMEQWLKAEPEKRDFRRFLNGVLPEFNSMYKLSSIVDLCSAVDSLGGIPNSSTISKSQMKQIVSAAEDEALCAQIPVEKGQIQSVLSNLRRQPFREKLKFVVNGAGLGLTEAQIVAFAKRVGKFRTYAAHGAGYQNLELPLLSPTLELFRLICVLFDLRASGLCEDGQKRFLGERDLSYLLSQLDVNID